MQIITFEQWQTLSSPCCVALGFFDGVHLAHASLLQTCAARKSAGLTPVVVTFRSHPAQLFGGRTEKLLSTFPERMQLLERLGIEYVLLLDDAKAVLAMEPEPFLELLQAKLPAREFCCGFDYTFAKAAKGTTADLEKFCREHSMALHCLSPQLCGGEKISSGRVRALIAQGEIEEANRLLFSPFSLTGEVVHGYARGRKLGFPTANLLPDEEKLLPKRGVYATSVLVQGACCFAVSNIGINPTFGANKLTCETHLHDFAGDLYGKTITVTFHKRLRGEMTFCDGEALRRQIQNDLEESKRYFSSL